MTDTSKKNIYFYLESFIIISVSLIALLVPILINRVNNHAFDWLSIFHSQLKVLSFVLIFIINIYVLIPLFLQKKNYEKYILYLLVILPFIVCIQMRVELSLTNLFPASMPPMELGPGMPPMELSEKMPAPHGFKLPELTKSNSMESQFLINLAIALMIVGVGTAYKTILFWNEAIKAKKELQLMVKKANEQVDEYIYVKADLRMVKIRMADILYIEGANEYIKIVLENGKTILTFMRLKNMEKELPPEKFMRVQRSFIINLEKIKAIEKNRILIEYDKYIPIGNQYKEEIQLYLSKNFIQ